MVETRSQAGSVPVVVEEPAPRTKQSAKEVQRFTPFAVLGLTLILLSLLPPLAPLHFVRSVFSPKAFGPNASTFTQALGAAKRVKDQALQGEVPEAAKEAAVATFDLLKSFVWPFGKSGGIYASLRNVTGTLEPTPAEKLRAAWEGLYQDPKVPTLWKTLVHQASSGLASAGILSLVLHGAALRNRLHLDLYRRLLQGLLVFGGSSAVVSALNHAYFNPTAFVSLLSTFLSVAAIAGFHLVKTQPPKTVIPLDSSPRSPRGTVYGLLSLLLTGAGLTYLLLPKATMEGVFGRHGGAVGRILWQLNATGVHTLVSYCLLNLKPLAERHHLNTATSALLNAATVVPGLVYLLGAVRNHFSGGLTGALLPLVVLTWTTATLFALINLPASHKTVKRYD